MLNRHYARGLAVGAVGTETVDLRAVSMKVAEGTDGDFVLTINRKDGVSVVEKLATREALDERFGKLADDQAEYSYVAMFDKTDRESWPKPFNEFGSAIKTIVVKSEPPIVVTKTEVETKTETVKKTQTGLGWVLGGIGAGLGMLFLVKKGRKV